LTGAIDLFLLTGFLGSGKTSLLVRFLGQNENADDTAVIVNEAGEINIDGAIIQSDASPLQLALLSNGCVCCSSAGELSATIEALIAARSQLRLPTLRRIIVETSGLSKPGPLLRQIGTLAAHPLRTRVVSTWDCSRSGLLLEFDEAQAQVAGANMIILTKRDIAGAEATQRAKRQVRSMNPFATIIDEASAEACVARAFADVVEPPDHANAMNCAAASHPHPRMMVWNHHFDRKVNWDDIAEWLDNLAGLAGARLLRVKGLIPVIGQANPVLVQGVGTTFSAPRGIVTGAAPFLVVIARDMTAADIEDLSPALPGLDAAVPGRMTSSFAPRRQTQPSDRIILPG
jgi:G3E family GTPase